jgi:hypothetical protein
MKMKKLLIAVCAVTLTLAGKANAQFLSGSVTATNYPIFVVASATSSSLMLGGTNIVAGTTGDFTGTVPLGGDFQVEFGRPAQITGLSTSPLDDPISHFFVFSTGYLGSGTTPDRRFEFDLQTITEDSYSGNGIGDFSGTGTLIDNAGVYASSPADFTVDFSNANNYVLTLAVPEPATAGLLATGLFGLWALRRRQG